MKLENNDCYTQLLDILDLPESLDDYFSRVRDLPLSTHLKCNYLLWRCSPERSQRNLIEYDSLLQVDFDTSHPLYLKFPSIYRTNDFRDKLRAAQLRRSPEVQERMNKSLTGKKRSPEARQKMSEARKGKVP